MTMNKVWDKLRKKNRTNYRQFQFCISFAVMLISSFLMMLMSPLVQNTLPTGGDSRTQIYMIFAIAMAGCTIFIIYATGLFYRFKSRDIGVFLALGTDKSKLTKATLAETAKIVAAYSVLGIAAGSIFSLFMGKIFQLIASRANDNKFAFTAMGFAGSFLYGAVVFLLVMAVMIRFMGKSNVMDILNQQRKQEPLKKTVTRGYLISGAAMVIAGLLIAFVMPTVVTKLFQHWMGAWTNLFYLLVLLGLYRIMVYSIASHRRGRNPQKYYNNVISYGMLKFQGGSIVRNMLVITLLIMGGLFASYYVPMTMSGLDGWTDIYEAMYNYRYPMNADEVTFEELEQLAAEYDVEIQDYREAEFVAVPASGIRSENWDENGNLIEEYEDRFAVNECIGASEYEELTGEKADVADGTYYMIMAPGTQESVFHMFGTMDKLYLGQSDEYLDMEYQGNVSYMSLAIGFGFDGEARYLISDRDYEVLKEGLDAEYIIKQVLFDTENSENVLDFSRTLFEQFVLRMSDNMNYISYYNELEHEAEGENYMYNQPAEVIADNPAAASDWKYAPMFVYMEEEYSLLKYAVYFLLFIYVAVICLAAVGIISYTRSQSVGISSRQVFDDVRKLGADKGYLQKLLKVQVKKVYVLPTVVGCCGMAVFELLMLFMNDGSYSKGEIQAMGAMAVLTVCVVLYQYLIYRMSLKKVAGMLELN